jgi:hypothetical protein
MIYTATSTQIWHEMQRQRASPGGEVVFRLVRDPSSTPYRYRGVPNFSVTASMSWFDGEIAIVDSYGRPWLPNWMQFSAALPALAGAGAGVVVSVVLDAPAVAWAPSASRDAKRVASMSEARAAWPGQIAALRAEWLSRRKTDRRTGYLAAADALASALDFDQARGAA